MILLSWRTKPVKVRSRLVEKGVMRFDRRPGLWMTVANGGDFCWEVRCASGCGSERMGVSFDGYISCSLDNDIVVFWVFVHCWVP